MVTPWISRLLLLRARLEIPSRGVVRLANQAVDRAENAGGGGPNQGPNDPGPVDQHAVRQFVGVDLGHHSGQGQSKGDAPKSADDAEPQSQENLGAKHLATGRAHRTKHGQLTLTF